MNNHTQMSFNHIFDSDNLYAGQYSNLGVGGFALKQFEWDDDGRKGQMDSCRIFNLTNDISWDYDYNASMITMVTHLSFVADILFSF